MKLRQVSNYKPLCLHYSDERGIMHALQVIEQYQAKEIDFQHNVRMISINRSATEADNVYEVVRYAWKLNAKKAQKSDFMLALQQGLVIGVFVPTKWLEATKSNFPCREDRPG